MSTLIASPRAGWRHAALSAAIATALAAPSAQAAPMFTEFSTRSGNDDPDSLAQHLIVAGTGISLLGSAQFQGNLDASGEGDEYGGDGYGGPDTVIGFFDASGALVNTDDDSGLFGSGLSAITGYLQNSPGGGMATFKVSGFDDFDFDGASDSYGGDGYGGDGYGGHGQFGGYSIEIALGNILPTSDFDANGFTNAPPPGLEQIGGPIVFTAFDGLSGDDVDEFSVSLEQVNEALGQAGPLGDGDAIELFASVLPDFFAPSEASTFSESTLFSDSDPDEPHGSAALFTALDLDEDGSAGGNFSLSGNGILLTSGVGTPPTSNTSDSFTGFASGQGDAGLDAILDASGESSTTTDATVLAFDFEVAEGINAVSLEYLFGTEEFPNFSNFNDLAAVFINGRNVTTFSDGSALVVNNDTFTNQLFDNSNSDLDIEYDGVSQRRTIIVPVEVGVNSIKIAVSDAVDSIFDTGLFVSDFRGLTLEAGISPSDPVLPAPGDDPADGFDLAIVIGDAGIGIDPTTPIWIDPPVAVGYVLTVESGAPNFSSLTLPAGFGDDLFTVSFFDGTGTVEVLVDASVSGPHVDFLSFNALGVSTFTILGIEAALGLDPSDATAFPVGVTFVSGGSFSVNMLAITGEVPEPGTLALFAGALALGWARRRRGFAALR